MQPGEVLVAGITTPAWTSLFAMASAVVTDVGGPLSHSSIVAREYGIPAVLGTGVATRRIQSGQTVQVDGDAGRVTLLDGPSAADAEQSLPEPVSRAPRVGVSTRTVAHFALATGAVVAAATLWRKRRRVAKRQRSTDVTHSIVTGSSMRTDARPCIEARRYGRRR